MYNLQTKNPDNKQALYRILSFTDHTHIMLQLFDRYRPTASCQGLPTVNERENSARVDHGFHGKINRDDTNVKF